MNNPVTIVTANKINNQQLTTTQATMNRSSSLPRYYKQ